MGLFSWIGYRELNFAVGGIAVYIRFFFLKKRYMSYGIMYYVYVPAYVAASRTKLILLVCIFIKSVHAWNCNNLLFCELVRKIQRLSVCIPR